MILVSSVAEMRAADAATIAGGTPSVELMRRAGRALFLSYDWPEKVGILVGGGNNGGDGYALACELKRAGKQPIIWRVSSKASEDGAYFRKCAWDLEVKEEYFTDSVNLAVCDVLVDCLLGTGFVGEPRGAVAEAIRAINQSKLPVVSADINSGLNGDTGEAVLAVRSDLTVTIGLYKTGLFKGEAPRLIRSLRLADIGILPISEQKPTPKPKFLDDRVIVVRD